MPKGPKPKPIEELFWSKVDKRADDECWPWTGYIQPNGYAKFAHRTGYWQAHRLAYTLMVGPIIKGLTIDHLCANPRCCNPKHMQPVPASENTRRALAARYAGKTHCVQGHERTLENTIIRKDGRRECRICDNERSRRSYLANQEERKAKMRAYYYGRKGAK